MIRAGDTSGLVVGFFREIGRTCAAGAFVRLILPPGDPADSAGLQDPGGDRNVSATRRVYLYGKVSLCGFPPATTGPRFAPAFLLRETHLLQAARLASRIYPRQPLVVASERSCDDTGSPVPRAPQIAAVVLLYLGVSLNLRTRTWSKVYDFHFKYVDVAADRCPDRGHINSTHSTNIEFHCRYLSDNHRRDGVMASPSIRHSALTIENLRGVPAIPQRRPRPRHTASAVFCARQAVSCSFSRRSIAKNSTRKPSRGRNSPSHDLKTRSYLAFGPFYRPPRPAIQGTVNMPTPEPRL
jgi:hypothetical protein